jgi:CrcB protein
VGITPSPSPPARLLPAIAAGGAFGSLGRYAVGLALPHTSSEFPWATLLVNLTGSLAMGLLVAWLVARPGAHPLARPFLGVGVLGGWTTYSAFAVDVVRLVDAGREQAALGYVTATFLLGVLAVGLGLRLGGRLWEPA